MKECNRVCTFQDCTVQDGILADLLEVLQMPIVSCVQSLNGEPEQVLNPQRPTRRQLSVIQTGRLKEGSSQKSTGIQPGSQQKEDTPNAPISIRRIFATLPKDAAKDLASSEPTRRGRGLAAHKILEKWLDLSDDLERHCYWLEIRGNLNPYTMEYIFLFFLQQNRLESALSSRRETLLPKMFQNMLSSQGFSEKDLYEWASIIKCVDPDEKARMFLSTVSARPTFLLLVVLRGKILQVRTLKLLLKYTRDHVLSEMAGAESSWHGNSDVQEREETDNYLPRNCDESFNTGIERQDLLGRLFDHARRIWPQAMVTVAEMMADYIRSVGTNSQHSVLDLRTHTRLCRLYNFFLYKVACSARQEPFFSTVHNWQAQRKLLEVGNQFRPALIANHNSYRAIVSVLAASRKSARESKAATLRARSWPPWRIEQHGIDAQRSREEDLSRVTLALSSAMESGYHLSTNEVAANILGGQELDGTPTIHTRTINNLNKDTNAYIPESLQPDIWAARIHATRDVEEAWGAFMSFTEAGGKPNQAMFAVMLDKLLFEQIRHSTRRSSYNSAPGDGREQLPPAHDGYSEFYRTKLRPPPLDDLYTEMLSMGIQPPERIVALLITKATTLNDGIQYLMDAGISHEAISCLKGHGETATLDLLKEIPDNIFSAFITLLCRYSPRVGSRERTNKPQKPRREGDNDDAPAVSLNQGQTTRKPTVVSDNEDLTIIELGPSNSASSRFPNPLLLATTLIMKRRPTFRPAWFALFYVLAREGCLIDRWVSMARNDLLAWCVLEAVLGDFHKLGLELDPRGFQIICLGVRKALLASLEPSLLSDDEELAIRARTGLTILKTEFRKLAESSTEIYLPKFLHSIRGVHLHAYIRAISVVNDYEEILYVLRWMVEHCETLNGTAYEAANGYSTLRRTLVSIKSALVDDMASSAEAKKLVESVDSWDGWPSDKEVEEYLQRGQASR
ncbi:hypothetical protein BP6252_02403 [Coleophoma cylindrospora]|uniref:Uncharacterized protein n=1 Tax=Coleophoma cylindrospora TaxID=1849047 RepID=A0A3D8SEU5_9HELO|nr:hypothetical protein BP6252_02403 [Coleophoma cylindrospora]